MRRERGREGGREGGWEGGREGEREGGFSPCYPVPYIVYSRLGLLNKVDPSNASACLKLEARLTKELGFGIYIYLLASAL